MTGNGTLVVHATAVAIGAHAVLLRGASGVGKSDLALRLTETGARLVADDRTELWVEDGDLYAAPPVALAGRLEVRGVGLVEVPFSERAQVVLAVDLCSPQDVERLPDDVEDSLLGVSLPIAKLAPFEASAPAKLKLLLDRALSRRSASAGRRAGSVG